MVIVTAVSKKIGRRIRQIREKTLIKGEKMTQEELAGEAGLNRAYIGYIERGERNPSTDTLVKIAKALKISPKELLS
ncbi:helix-turn-helix transcriptional regulator [Candidatus Gottesmanbacteria bacterium]|nr:helix-turn-helix transcriptional regulator [Candidatus Gottesmanbacteria bacterium]